MPVRPRPPAGRPPARCRRGCRNRYVLAVGARRAAQAPRAAASRRTPGPAPAGLGPGSCSPATARCASSPPGAGATCSATWPDAPSTRLYRDALALVCVSREEGFGFTPLEALARGTPAVVSDLPVFGETLGAGALRVPQGDADALARGPVATRARRPRCAARLAEAGGRRPRRGCRGASAARARARCSRRRRESTMTFTIVTVIHDSRRRPGAPARLARALPQPGPRARGRGQRLHRRRPPTLARAAGARGRSSSTATAASAPAATRASSASPSPLRRWSTPTSSCSTTGSRRSPARRPGPDALLAPRLLNADGSVQDSAHPLPGTARGALPAARPALPAAAAAAAAATSPGGAQRPAVVGWAIAACLVARTDLLRRLGPFDPARVPLLRGHGPVPAGAPTPGCPTLLRPEVALRHLGGASIGRALGGADRRAARPRGAAR